MTTQTTGMAAAFKAFLDRRAIIMLFLGFSSGLPIFLIFGTLSFWLKEAGVELSTITMFSWASLAYAFKFIWAPLIDKLPIPYLTAKMGRRRSWLLLSQLLVISAICLMSSIDPSPNLFSFGTVPNVVFMALSAVFLGFSSATQDIIVDAYRIELSQDPNLQTVLASTYNAGYRIATIITQLGGLLLAASLGTAAGNYIYSAWQTTYLAIAALMCIGVATTLLISEPKVVRKDDRYSSGDYLQLFALFIGSTVVFIAAFYMIGILNSYLMVTDPILKFVLQVLRFVGAIATTAAAVWVFIETGIINQKIVFDTWVNPLLDFFKRYGVKVALAILLLIGFYRISDVVAGVMANLFYLDLNFDKEEIAWFNKFVAVIFVIIGGFIGGILAQKYNIMKMMLVGAIVACTTNLIFVGLVKSGAQMNAVELQLGSRTFQVMPNEVGSWNIDIPQSSFAAADVLKIRSRPEGFSQALSLDVKMPRYQGEQKPELLLYAIGGDDKLYQNQLLKDVSIRGRVVNLPAEAVLDKVEIQLPKKAPILAKTDHANVAQLENNGTAAQLPERKQALQNINYNMVVPGPTLAELDQLVVVAHYTIADQAYQLKTQHPVHQLNGDQPKQRIALLGFQAIDTQQADTVKLSGKVIVPYSKVWLVLGIVFDNMASGLAGAVFIAFLSSLTSISFTAMQYAIFSSLMLLFPKAISGYSGTIVSNLGYSGFFTMTALMGVPIIFLVLWVARLLKERGEGTSS
ncbi:AmpG family muropeptide MFS transporter [Acinetobacter larvae]|uniref:MFS transporter n=1 Tax=Acinetobacter larvae TaxID=1789224 RepID=A0A1B2M1A0_9GAMM|nr:MFS transporter [Acinetobacter larvae]AOA58970.1 MFS transporter [Acinetobacter larvae]